MAREKKKNRNKKILLPEDVLEGRVKVDPLELFRLIHRVNPTNRPLSAKEAKRRYAEKHKLQSFLVLNFGEEHVVVSRTEEEGVVSLDHPSGVFDACHAPLAELEPEARSWIQRRLDMEGDDEDEVLRLPSSGAGVGEAPDDGEVPQDPLAAARRALAEFDYSKAERLLTRAFDAEEGGVPVARELLALKVETLGLDEEALALRPRMSEAAAGDVDVRSLLALAAARQGDTELAEKLVTGLADSGSATSQARRAAACAALAAGAVRTGEADAARQWLAELARCDPFHEGVAAVRAGLERLAQAEMREAEAELDELCRERGCLEAAGAARALADRFPGSEVARRILREAAELRRQTALAEHLEIADRALAEESFATAVRHYEAVLAEDADVPDVPRRLEQARRGAREKAEASAVGAVERLFGEGDSRRALVAYLELSHALRDRLRSRLGDPDARSTVSELDSVDSAHPRLKAVAAVDAVLALRKAEQLLAENHAGRAFDALEPHQEVLAAVKRARPLWENILDSLAREHAKRNLELLRQVEASMKDESTDMDPDKNLALLDEVDPRFLSPDWQKWAEMARASMLFSKELHSLTESYKNELAAGELFAARQKVRRYKEMAKKILPAERLATWKLPGEFLDDEIKRVWQVKHESWRLGRALRPYPGLLQPRPGQEWRSESCGVDDEGRRLVVAQAFVDWLFLTVIDVRSGKVLERLSMVTPKALGAPLSTCWDGDTIRIGGGEGGVLVLEPDGWKIAEWEWMPRHLGKGRVERTVVLPRSPYVWAFSRDRGDSFPKVRILERDAWRVMRQQTWVLAASVLYGLRPYSGPRGPRDSVEASPPPRVLMSGKGGTFLYAARGHRDSDEPLTSRYAVAGAADGTGIVALVMSPPEDLETAVGPTPDPSRGRGRGGDQPGEDQGLGLARFEPGPDGWQLAREVRLAMSAAKGMPVMAAAQGVVWALFDATDGEAWLTAVVGETLEPLYSLRVPRASALAGDRYGRYAVLVADGDRGPEVVPLGRDEPRLQWKWRPLAERRFPLVELQLNCMIDSGRGREALRSYDAVSRSKRREFVLRTARESTAENLADVSLLAYVLHDRDERLGRDFLAELHRRHHENLDVMFLLADWQCRYATATQKLEDWKQAIEMVLGTAPEWMTMNLRHFYHVQGVAYLLAGNFEKSLETFEAGLAHDDGGCDLEPLTELVKPMKDPPKASEWGARHPVTRQLVGALRTATAALARDDDKAVVSVLERPVVWLAAETETLLRLALAHIALAGDPADAGFEARLALSYLLEVIKVDGPRRIPSANLATAAEALKEAGDNVRQWLAIVADVEAKVRKERRSKDD